MAENPNGDLVQLLREEMAQQRAQMAQQRAQHKEEMAALIDSFKNMGSSVSKFPTSSFPSFHAFDDSSELWPDYHNRFETYVSANSISEDKMPQVFLTNQSAGVYKMLENLASQTNPPLEINKLTMPQIVAFMKEQYDPKTFIIRERFKFWTETKRKPGETPAELAARIRKKAATCDFSSISNPLDEALRTCFICAINNEAVLKCVFKMKDEELTFKTAVAAAVEIEESARAYPDRLRNDYSQATTTRTRSLSCCDIDSRTAFLGIMYLVTRRRNKMCNCVSTK